MCSKKQNGNNSSDTNSSPWSLPGEKIILTLTLPKTIQFFLQHFQLLIDATYNWNYNHNWNHNYNQKKNNNHNEKSCLEDNTAYFGNNIVMGGSNPQPSRDVKFH